MIFVEVDYLNCLSCSLHLSIQIIQVLPSFLWKGVGGYRGLFIIIQNNLVRLMFNVVCGRKQNGNNNKTFKISRKKMSVTFIYVCTQVWSVFSAFLLRVSVWARCRGSFGAAFAVRIEDAAVAAGLAVVVQGRKRWWTAPKVVAVDVGVGPGTFSSLCKKKERE